MGRIISTSSTNTRHKHKQKRSKDNTHTQNTNIQRHHENHWIDCIYHAASYGFSTFWSLSFPREWRYSFRLQEPGRTRAIDILDPLPHLTLMDQSYSDPLFSFGLPDNINELLLSEALGNLQQDVPAPRGRKLALIPLADLADIGLGVQKIINPTNGQVNSND